MARLSLRVIESKHESVRTSQLTVAGRPSAILCLESDGGLAHGEATPLAGFGDDDWGVALAELNALEAEEVGAWVERVAAAFDPGREGLLGSDTDPAMVVGKWSEKFRSRSARFAGECLVLGAAAKTHGVTLGRLLSADVRARSFPTSAVIDPSSASWEARFEEEITRGVRTFKIKCALDEARELETVELLLDHGERPRFRLDANRGWTAPELLSFVSGLDQERLDWVEDPTNDLSEWDRLSHVVPLAIDEPLASFKGDEARLPQTLVLKPMALGGISTCMKWTALAQGTGRQVCLSHFFDGPVAMQAYIQLAFALNSPDVTPGLGLHQALDGYAELGISVPELEPAKIACPNGTS